VPEIVLDGERFLVTLVTVLVIMDPVGNVPIFLALTRDQAETERRRSALVATFVAAIVIAVFAVAGERLLQLVGISLEALQVAGGLLLLIIGYELLNPGGSSRLTTAEGDANVALVPLGTPLLAGPGAIAATMLATAESDSIGETLSVFAALAVVFVVVYLAMRFASTLARILSPTIIDLISRVLGLVVAAIGVQLLAGAIEVWVRDGVN